MTEALTDPDVEAVPSLRLWGELAPIIAKIVNHQPSLGRRIILAPQHVVHSLAAYISYAVSRGLKVEVLASSIMERDIRDLLSEAVPDPHPRLFRTLAKIGLTVRELAYYHELNDGLNGPASSILLRADRISLDQLSIVSEIAKDTVLINAAEAIGDNRNSLRNLRAILCFLRLRGIANHIEALPAGSGWNTIIRRIRADMEHARAPTAPFVPPSGWSLVEDVATLWNIGERMHNCVAPFALEGERHLRDFLSLQAVFLVNQDDDGIMLAAIQNVGSSLWTIEEFSTHNCKGSENDEKKELEVSLSEAMRATGHTLIETDPIHAMGLLSRRRQRTAGHDIGEQLDSLVLQ